MIKSLFKIHFKKNYSHIKNTIKKQYFKSTLNLKINLKNLIKYLKNKHIFEIVTINNQSIYLMVKKIKKTANLNQNYLTNPKLIKKLTIEIIYN